MKKLFLSIFTVLCLFAPAAALQPAYAAFDAFEIACDATLDDPNTPGNEAKPAPTDSSVCSDNAPNAANPLTGDQGIILKAVRIITMITGIASVIVVIFAGIKYITSNGDSNTISSAKSTMLYAIIGVVISVMSQAIILFVINRI